MDSLTKRHGGDHYANIKYGYIVLAVSIVYLAVALRFRRARSPYSVLVWVIVVCVTAIPVLDAHHASTLLKRFGRISYALIPLNIVLALRPNVISYLDLLPLHKWLSRWIAVLAAVHSVGFAVKWAAAGEMFKILRPLNAVGVPVFIVMVVLLVVSVRRLRTKNYRLFYWVHQVGVVLMVVAVIWHARPGVTPLALLNVLLLVVQIVLKYNRVAVDVQSVKSYGQLAVVLFEKPQNYPLSLPGNHLALTSRWYNLMSHPYTIVNYHENIALVVDATNKFEITTGSHYISYPYSMTNAIELGNSVVLFAGGSGISFALSMIVYYQNLQLEADFTLVWAVRDVRDTELINSFSISCKKHIYITGSMDNDSETGRMMDVELEDYNQGFKTGRPLFEEYGTPDTLVVCGPLDMMEQGQKYANKHNIKYIGETYAF